MSDSKQSFASAVADGPALPPSVEFQSCCSSKVLTEASSVSQASRRRRHQAAKAVATLQRSASGLTMRATFLSASNCYVDPLLGDFVSTSVDCTSSNEILALRLGAAMASPRKPPPQQEQLSRPTMGIQQTNQVPLDLLEA